MFVIVALSGCCVLHGIAAENPAEPPRELHRLLSPDGHIQATLQMPEPGTAEAIRWGVVFYGRALLGGCGLGLQTADDGDWLAGARLLLKQSRSSDEPIPVLFGKTAQADNRFRETRYVLETSNHRRVDVVFRCYNDAVAFRYEVPKSKGATSITIRDETTSFRLEDNPTVYAQYLENYTTSHEHNVTVARSRELKRGALLDLPLSLSWADGTFAAITEASLRRYAGMSLMRTAEASAGDELSCRLTPRPNGTKVIAQLPMQSPWRVVMVAEGPGRLLESSRIYSLNEPPAFRDLSWLKPGKITFSWWNGDIFGGGRSAPILSVEMAKKYIDFCASQGIPTHSLTSTEGNVVSPWYEQSNIGGEPGPDTDVTRPRADFNLAAIRQYAQSKNIRLWTWVHQAALRGKVEQAFAAFEHLGWSGLMVDFFDHDDQESVEFAESILQAAARHHLLVQFHGIWKPTGLQRTYPNLVNQEGALNLEYLKWSDRCTPEHNLMMCFTRLLAGPMDYHLGGFRAVTRAKFKPRNEAPNVLGTRGHHLAMYVCFDNPNPMVADDPAAYEGQVGFDFLQKVPTWWDETRVLVAQIGEVLVTARRKGSTWYVGGMSARRPRDLTLPLTFLNTGSYVVHIWKDAPDADTEPNHLETKALSVSSASRLQIHFAVDGGFVAEISPAIK